MLFLTSSPATNAIPDWLLLTIVGLAGLLILARTLMKASKAKDRPPQAPAAEVPAGAAAVSADAGKVPATGSLGEVDLHTVDDKTAALLMAIVADDLNAPLNTLRFTSIRELGKDEPK